MRQRIITEQAKRLAAMITGLGVSRRAVSIWTETEQITDPYTHHRYTQYGMARGVFKIASDAIPVLLDMAEIFSVYIFLYPSGPPRVYFVEPQTKGPTHAERKEGYTISIGYRLGVYVVDNRGEGQRFSRVAPEQAVAYLRLT